MIPSELSRQNLIVLAVIQALLGVLSTRTKAVTLEFVGEDVVAHFLMHEYSAEDQEELEENFPTEVAAFTLGMPEVGDILITPSIEFTAGRAPGYLPPGRRVVVLRD